MEESRPLSPPSRTSAAHEGVLLMADPSGPRVWHWAARVLLLVLTALAMLTQGGILVIAYPPLAMGHWCACRHSGMIGRFFWTVLSAAAAFLWAWQAFYGLTEGRSPNAYLVS